MRKSTDMTTFLGTPESECSDCQRERHKRKRVVGENSPVPSEVHEAPFIGAPALYTFNVPRYFATNLRAREYAKQNNVQLSWCYARDVPLHPEDRELPPDRLQTKLISWLKRHDQETRHIPSIYPLAVGMPVRLTENIDRSKQLYRGRKGVIYGWTTDTLPLAIDERCAGARWTMGGLPL